MSKNKILEVSKANVRCHAIVDLISKVERPYRFKVTVTGDPPHAYTRVYDIQAVSETDAAMAGIKRFTDEMEAPIKVLEPVPWY